MLHLISIFFSAVRTSKRMFMYVWFWILLFSCLPVVGQSACTLSIRGIVTHSTQETLPGAIIYIPQLHQGTTTNEKGVFYLKNLCPGSYTLVCQYVGHQAQSRLLTLSASTDTIHFELAELSQTLETIQIHGNTETPIHSQSQAALQGADLKRVEGAALGEMLKTLPGMNSIQTGPSISKPVIHGLHSNRVLILNNGIRQEGQQWGSEHAPEIDPFVAKRVTVLKGASSVRYGADAIGGVILVEPESLPYANPLAGEVNILGYSNNRQLTTSALLEGSAFKKLAWRLQGTYKKAGTAQTPDYYLTNTQFEEQNFSLSAGYHANRFGVEAFFSRFSTDIGIFQGAHIGNSTDLNTILQNSRPTIPLEFSYAINRPYQDIAHHLLKISSYYNHPSLGKLNLTLGYQQNSRQEYDLTRGSDTQPSTDFQLYTYTYELLWEHRPLHKNNTGTIGISNLYQGNAIDGKRIFLPNFNNLGIGVFAIEHWVKNNWELEAGIRYDYRFLQIYRRKRGNSSVVLSPSYTYQNLAGTIGAVYYPNNTLSIRLNLGTAWRPPTAAELYSDGVHHGAATYEKGDSTQTSEKSYQATGSVQWHPTSQIQLEIGGYVNYMQGYLYLTPDSLPQVTIAGAFPSYQYTQVNTLFKGLDATIKYTFLPKLYWQGKMAIVRARNLTANEYQNFIPADRFENLVRYENPTWKKLKNLYIEVLATNVLRQKRTPTIGILRTEVSGVEKTIYINDFRVPPDGYTLLQAEVGCTIPVCQSMLDISLSVQNLANTRYREYLNRFRYFADDTGRNILLRLKYRF